MSELTFVKRRVPDLGREVLVGVWQKSSIVGLRGKAPVGDLREEVLIS